MSYRRTARAPRFSARAHITVLVIGMLAALTVIAWSWVPARLPPVPDLAYRTELGDENSAEALLRHGRNEAGQRVTSIFYRTGDRGQAVYRTDGTLGEFSVVGPNGAPRLHAVFDTQGTTVINGFELRADGSRVWTTEKLKDGNLKTVTYWKSEEVRIFSEVIVNLSAGTVERTYYRPLGDVWAHHIVSSRDGTEKVLSEEVYGARDKLARLRRSPLDSNEAVMAYYRNDGMLEFKQNYGPEPGAGAVDHHEGGKPPMVTALRVTTIYAADGIKPVRQIGFEGQGSIIPWIAVINDDGSMDVTDYAPNLTVTRKQHLLADGTVTASQNRFRRPERMEPVEQRYRDNFPPAFDPTGDWAASEDRDWLAQTMRRAAARR